MANEATSLKVEDDEKSLPTWSQLHDQLLRATGDLSLQVLTHRARGDSLNALRDSLIDGIGEVLELLEAARSAPLEFHGQLSSLQQQLEGLEI